MPNYVKFMKDILSKKKRLSEYETISLTKECSAFLQNKLPPKLKDPRSFMIPCNIGESYCGKALYDLGAKFEADKEVSIILRRPFLATRRTLIDVQKGKLTMRVQDDKVTFNVMKVMKFLDLMEECSVMEELDSMGNNSKEDLLENVLESEPFKDEKEKSEKGKIDGQRRLNSIIKEVVQKEMDIRDTSK
ncbi:uncharacterized protein [Gossypium hirsutum]|uniref:Uncharacterized protein n=1 Tax=Gossypium hirsutum TaxID=3635 RepID=A0A1U8PVH3_GOSHI|nr:uncharacterized protein LOC107963073 [Gossypium hirsutum]